VSTLHGLRLQVRLERHQHAARRASHGRSGATH
jgi:hypothetical protein